MTAASYSPHAGAADIPGRNPASRRSVKSAVTIGHPAPADEKLVDDNPVGPLTGAH
jgi:hypothetical protein